MSQLTDEIMLSILENILIAVERIEKKINQCGLCQGVGSRQYANADHLCAQCNGKGVMR